MATKPLNSSTTSNGGPATSGPNEKSFFEQQRELLVRDIGISMENVLQNINKLNRSLEGIISIGNEFASVEALWSHFENVMAKDVEGEAEQAGVGQSGETGGDEEVDR